MNSRQKFGYTILGAVIMLVGMGIGAIVSPNLTAREELDEIVCSGLTIVNERGQKAIRLYSQPNANHLKIYDSFAGQKPVIHLTDDHSGTELRIVDFYQKDMILLRSDAVQNVIRVRNQGDIRAIELVSPVIGLNGIEVYDREGNLSWFSPWAPPKK